MRDLAILSIHLLATIAKLMAPGGARAVVAESLLVKHQLLILNRSRERAPNLRPIDRVIAGLCAGFIRCASCLIIRRPSGGHSNIFMVEAADAFERNHPPLLRRLDRPAFRCVLI